MENIYYFCKEIIICISMENPFVFQGYAGPDYFCDRQKELQALLQCVRNNVNVTLVAQRRMGKTGLIQRLVDEISASGLEITPIYVDIFATRNVAEMNKVIADAILSMYPEDTSLGKRFLKFIKGLRPVIGFDSLSGTPQFYVNYQNDSEKVSTLEGLLAFLEQQPEHVLLAIDEFQQIREYPEQNVEAIMRTVLQHTRNITCIFCGSRKHLMVDIFSNPKRPFYASTQFVGLDRIERGVYGDFIKTQFETRGRSIDDDALNMILDWTRRHTYFTQRLCNMVYAMDKEHIAADEVKQGCINILEINEPYFLQYRSLLTDSQWAFMVALAKEEEVEQPYSSNFIRKHDIASAAVARRNLQTLMEKDLVYCETTKERKYYSLQDVFFMRWLAREY